MSVLIQYDRSGKAVKRWASGAMYKDLKITETLEDSGAELELTVLGDTPPDPELIEGYLEDDRQRYTIKEISGQNIIAKLSTDGLEGAVYNKYTAELQTQQAMFDALGLDGWTLSSPFTDKRSVRAIKATPLTILQHMRDAWMCEMHINAKDKIITMAEQLGRDIGSYAIKGFNLKTVDRAADSYDFYTRIIPTGADGLTIEAVNDGLKYLEDTSWSPKIRTLIWEDTSYTDAQTLKDDAAKKLAEMAKPKVSYTAEVRDLAALRDDNAEELTDESGEALTDMVGAILYDDPMRAGLQFSLGDTIHIVAGDLHDVQRIVKYTKYPDTPAKNELELSTTIETYESQQAKLKAAAAAWEDVTDGEGVNGVYISGISGGAVGGIELKVNGESYGTTTMEQLNINDGEKSIVGLMNNIAVIPSSDESDTGEIVVEGVMARVATTAATPTEPTDYRKLNGQILQDRSVKAKQIDLDDVFGQTIEVKGLLVGATLAGAVGSFAGTVTADHMQMQISNPEDETAPTALDIASLTAAGDSLQLGYCDGAASSPTFVFQQGGGISTSATLTAKVVAPSDERLKENIAPAEITPAQALEILSDVPVHSFDWRATGEHVPAGFIAQELAYIDASLVKENNDLLGVDDHTLLVWLLMSVQELRRRTK